MASRKRSTENQGFYMFLPRIHGGSEGSFSLKPIELNSQALGHWGTLRGPGPSNVGGFLPTWSPKGGGVFFFGPIIWKTLPCLAEKCPLSILIQLIEFAILYRPFLQQHSSRQVHIGTLHAALIEFIGAGGTQQHSDGAAEQGLTAHDQLFLLMWRWPRGATF